jgi:hypothetical protein
VRAGFAGIVNRFSGIFKPLIEQKQFLRIIDIKKNTGPSQERESLPGLRLPIFSSKNIICPNFCPNYLPSPEPNGCTKEAHCINILKIVGGLTGRFCGPPKKFGGFREQLPGF